MSVALSPPLRAVPSTDLDRIPALVSDLRATFEAGRTRPLGWRRQQIQQLRAMVRDHGDEFVEALHADLRKPPLEAWAADVGQVTLEAGLALRNLKRWTRPERASWIPIIALLEQHWRPVLAGEADRATALEAIAQGLGNR